MAQVVTTAQEGREMRPKCPEEREIMRDGVFTYYSIVCSDHWALMNCLMFNHISFEYHAKRPGNALCYVDFVLDKDNDPAYWEIEYDCKQYWQRKGINGHIEILNSYELKGGRN